MKALIERDAADFRREPPQVTLRAILELFALGTGDVFQCNAVDCDVRQFVGAQSGATLELVAADEAPVSAFTASALAAVVVIELLLTAFGALFTGAVAAVAGQTVAVGFVCAELGNRLGLAAPPAELLSVVGQVTSLQDVRRAETNGRDSSAAWLPPWWRARAGAYRWSGWPVPAFRQEYPGPRERAAFCGEHRA